MKRVFLSQISEVAPITAIVKAVMNRDFLGIISVVVSCGRERMATVEKRLKSIDQAL